ncbi:uncharacterized protein JCM15063_006038 [Sporobolomyces koalae]|uniref:uncharacterized protein n=1 Tax=Sporobolomyces koalae TaxID=500713 RepID=UPI003171F617
MPSSEYKHKPGGGLKLKGGGAGATDPSKKKKKKSSVSKKAREGEDSREVTRRADDDDNDGDYRRDRSDSPVASGPSSSGPAKTKAQLRFEEVQRKRLLDKSSKAALKSHKERVAEFNEKLENISEHYDIPKASPKTLLSPVKAVLIIAALIQQVGPG